MRMVTAVTALTANCVPDLTAQPPRRSSSGGERARDGRVERAPDHGSRLRAVRRRAGARRADGRQHVHGQAPRSRRDAVGDLGPATHPPLPGLARDRLGPSPQRLPDYNDLTTSGRWQRSRATATGGVASMPSQLPSGRWRTRVRHPRTGKQLSARTVIGGPETYATRDAATQAEAEARRLLRQNARVGVTVAEFWADWTSDPLWLRPARSTNLHNRERTSKFVAAHG